MEDIRDRIPEDWPVQPTDPADWNAHTATCGTCGLSWNDSTVTSMTPVPAGRCPFEAFHAEPHLAEHVLDTLSNHKPKTVYDPAGQVFYEPFISDDGRVGYRVGRTDDRPDAETFIYFNPSQSDGGDDSPNVFVYIGQENDPAEDEPQHFYPLRPGDFGL